jgi:hypothetical protein
MTLKVTLDSVHLLHSYSEYGWTAVDLHQGITETVIHSSWVEGVKGDEIHRHKKM